jgi:hypothetical protein
MHAGITAITELAVKSGLTNRLPPAKAKQSFFLALSPLPKRRQSGFSRARKRESQRHVNGCDHRRATAPINRSIRPNSREALVIAVEG